MTPRNVLVMAAFVGSCGSPQPMPFEPSFIDTFTGTWSSSSSSAGASEQIVIEKDPDGLGFYLGKEKCRVLFAQTGTSSAIFKLLPTSPVSACQIQNQKIDIKSGSADIALTTEMDSSCTSTTTTQLTVSLVTSQFEWKYTGKSQRFDFNNNCHDCPIGKMCY